MRSVYQYTPFTASLSQARRKALYHALLTQNQGGGQELRMETQNDSLDISQLKALALGLDDDLVSEHMHI